MRIESEIKKKKKKYNYFFAGIHPDLPLIAAQTHGTFRSGNLPDNKCQKSGNMYFRIFIFREQPAKNPHSKTSMYPPITLNRIALY